MFFINVRFLEEELTGIGRFSTEVSKRLAKIFPDAILISPPNVHVPFGWNILKKGFYRGAFWEQFQLPFFINRNSWCFNPANTSSLFLDKNITVIHDIIPITNPEWYSFQARIYYNFLLPIVIRRAKCIITVSQFNKQEINKKLSIPLDKIYVAPNAVDSYWHQVTDKPEYENYILTIASFDPRKNLKRLIEAFKMLEDKSIKLVIVGHKHKAFASQDLQLSEEDMKRIIFTGYVSDEKVRSLYSFANVFVFPSLKEGFGIPPLEAMACGCPVVASNSSSIPEVCGDAAIYINPLDSHSIYLAVKSVLTNKKMAVSMIQQGKDRAKMFSWDATVEVISAVIKLNMEHPKM